MTNGTKGSNVSGARAHRAITTCANERTAGKLCPWVGAILSIRRAVLASAVLPGGVWEGREAGEQKVVNWLVQNGFAGAAQLYATGR